MAGFCQQIGIRACKRMLSMSAIDDLEVSSCSSGLNEADQARG